MPVDLLTFVLAGGILLVAAFVQGYTGFGSALVAIPLLSLFLDVKLAVPLVVLASLLITASLSWELRRRLDRRKLLPLLAGAMPGIAVGALLLKDLPTQVLEIGLGGLLILYAGVSLAFRLRPRWLHAAWAPVAGFASGLLAATLSTVGPPVIVYTSMTRWSKNDIKATLSGFFLIAAALTAVVHAAAGVTRLAVVWLFLAALPGIVAGVLLGSRLSRRASEGGYRRLLLALLGVMGVVLLSSALV